MKLNLVYGSGEKMGGFLNISPFPQEDEDFVMADVCNLDMFVDDAESDVIIAYDVINFITKPRVIGAIDHWIKKLRHGGRILIGGVDIYELSRDIFTQNTDIKTINSIIFGDEAQPWDIRKNCFYTESLVNHFVDNGLEILKTRIDKYNMIVEAIRP